MRDCGYRGFWPSVFHQGTVRSISTRWLPAPQFGTLHHRGSTTNQFPELVRYLVEEPLQEPRPVAPTVMKNILGQDLRAAERSLRRTCRAFTCIFTARRVPAQTQDGAHHVRRDDRRGV